MIQSVVRSIRASAVIKLSICLMASSTLASPAWAIFKGRFVSENVLGGEQIEVISDAEALQKVLSNRKTLIPVKVNSAICDNRITDCDLQVMTMSGKQIRFHVRKNGNTIVYISTHGMKSKVPVSNGHDVDLLLRLASTLEKYGSECESFVIVNSENGKIPAIGANPSCLY